MHKCPTGLIERYDFLPLITKKDISDNMKRCSINLLTEIFNLLMNRAIQTKNRFHGVISRAIWLTLTYIL